MVAGGRGHADPNKGRRRGRRKSGFGKANDRVEAKEHRPSGILGGSVVGCPLSRREKARPLFEDHY